jgi:hypothetical protein
MILKFKEYILFYFNDFKYLLKYIKNYLFLGYFLSDTDYNKRLFFKSFGYYPDLNNPKTLNEKIILIKILKLNKKYYQYVDKFTSRILIGDIIGHNHLVPILFHSKSPLSLSYTFIENNLPCIIKTNHGSGDFVILRNKDEIDILKLKLFFSNAMKRNLDIEKREYQYSGIEKMIIIEKLLLNSDNTLPQDFKIHCFNGIPEFIYVTTGRDSINPYRGLYSINWEPLNFKWTRTKNNKDEYTFNNCLKKPKNLNDIISISKLIAAKFSDTYVRIDLYNIDENKVYFGEITFSHMSGLAKITPVEFDYFYGSKLTIKR